MNSLRFPYSMQPVTANMVLQAFQQRDRYKENIKTLLKEREFLLQDLRHLSVEKKADPADSKYILFEIPGSLDVSKLMTKHGLICRYNK